MHDEQPDDGRDLVAGGQVRQPDGSDQARPCVPATRAKLRRTVSPALEAPVKAMNAAMTAQ